jgi:hypothetical protein
MTQAAREDCPAHGDGASGRRDEQAVVGGWFEHRIGLEKLIERNGTGSPSLDQRAGTYGGGDGPHPLESATPAGGGTFWLGELVRILFPTGRMAGTPEKSGDGDRGGVRVSYIGAVPTRQGG